MSTVQVLIGLGFVIFIHELGHFLLAKWNGVKVEKFSIGFGPPLLAWRRGVGLRLLSSTPVPDPAAKPEKAPPVTGDPVIAPLTEVGETEYALASIPLGGFVKMLGESQDEQVSSSDPRAYPNKSVGARMAIISAGVVMNVLFGLACFAWAYSRGVKTQPAVLGWVKPGSPAYEAGMRAGDIVTALDGKRSAVEGLEFGGHRPVEYDKLRMQVALSGHDDLVAFEVQRPGVAEPLTFNVEPRLGDDDLLPTVGVLWPSEPVLEAGLPYVPPAGLVGPPPGSPPLAGERVVAVAPPGGTALPVESLLDLNRILTADRAVPLTITLESPAAPGATPTRREVTLPPALVVDLGLRMAAGPVAALRKDGPAARAGFRAGDEIVRIDGRDDFDPMRLPDFFDGRAGGPVEVVVLRGQPSRARKQEVTLKVVPEAQPIAETLAGEAPLDIPSIGLALPVTPRVAAVEPGSPAAEAGLEPGDVVESLTLEVQGGAAEPIAVTYPPEAGRPVPWALAMERVQAQPAQDVTLKVQGRAGPLTLRPRPVDGWYLPFRGLQSRALVVALPPQGPVAAVRRGIGETAETALSILFNIRGLVTGRLSRKLMSGPIGIFRMGHAVASHEFIELVRFLGMLSINLAVINFLPIPPLDGGQMVFLLAEKVRGRPLPESALAAMTYLGVILVLSLGVLVIFQDVVNLFQR